MKALWYVAPGRAELRGGELGPLAPGSVRIRTLFSAISRGTERLVFNGLVPESEFERMRAPLQDGAFPFPVKYGYCAAGVVADGPAEWIGRAVFALHPHQDEFHAPIGLVSPVPEGVPPRRAILAANMETALNALWDSGAGPGDRIVVVGAGLIGLLVAFLAAALPGAEVAVVDPDPSREAPARLVGAAYATEAPPGADVVFHASATEAGLSTALACAGDEAAVLELSWHGDRLVRVPMGAAFHSRRLRLVSSQVGQVAASRRARWTHARRMAKALELLRDERLDALITSEVAFGELAEALPGILADRAGGLCTLVRYQELRAGPGASCASPEEDSDAGHDRRQARTSPGSDRAGPRSAG